MAPESLDIIRARKFKHRYFMSVNVRLLSYVHKCFIPFFIAFFMLHPDMVEWWRHAFYYKGLKNCIWARTFHLLRCVLLSQQSDMKIIIRKKLPHKQGSNKSLCQAQELVINLKVMKKSNIAQRAAAALLLPCNLEHIVRSHASNLNFPPFLHMSFCWCLKLITVELGFSWDIVEILLKICCDFAETLLRCCWLCWESAEMLLKLYWDFARLC